VKAISIDSGGTKVVGAVVDDSGNILTRHRIEVVKRDGNCLVEHFKEVISRYLKDYSIDAIGIGGNGRIDPEEGVILDSGVHKNWAGRHLRRELMGLYNGLPISIRNDCHCAIKGESWMGSIHDFETVVGIIIGTGLGGALIENGKFWYGKRYSAGEIGHTILHPDGHPCYCGQRGCTERYVSGTALWKNYNEAVGDEVINSGYEFFDCYRSDDPIAQQCLEEFLDGLKLLMINISNICAPEAILIGGGIADTHALWADRLEQLFVADVGDWLKNTSIVYSSLGNDAAILGAAKFAFELL